MTPLLKDVKKVVIVNAGHHDGDSGAVHEDIIEAIECKKVRDALVPMLVKAGYTVHVVPDNLTLAQSIAWANGKAPTLNDGLAIDIHFNYLSNVNARGTEAFHGTSITSSLIAKKLSAGVAAALGIPDRGAKPDTQTAVGSLAWIRKTSMWASLIEIAFITNKDDMEVVRTAEGYQKAATGMLDAINGMFGVVPPPAPEPPASPTLANATNDQLLAEVKARLA